MKTSRFLLVLLLSSTEAFTAPKLSTRKNPVDSIQRDKGTNKIVPLVVKPLTLRSSSSSSNSGDTTRNTKAVLTTVALWTVTSELASAAGPDWGIFEGRTGSLLHPVTMGGLFLFSAYTAFLGFQWRRQRTLGEEILQLKKTLPDSTAAVSASEALAAAQQAGDTAQVAVWQAAARTQDEIAALTQERKDLAAAGPRDKHFSQGALLAFIGTTFAIEGPLNTYARAGKLFPGPHLYVGAALVVIWSLAVGTIPAMQKGNDTARTIHIAANLTGLAFFAWQVQSGIPILLKVIEKTSWP